MQLSGFAAGPYKTNTYLLATDTRAVVVDPGLHAADRVNAFLADKGLALEAIVLTHGHLDHTREAGDLAAAHSVPVWIHEDDAFMLEKGKGGAAETQFLFSADQMIHPADLRFLRDGETYTFAETELTVRHAPGHSPGSVLLVAEDFAIVGDVIFRGSIGRTDFPTADPAAMDETLRGPVWDLDDALALLPGHGPTTVMRAERAGNPFLKAANHDR
ncbi:MBL fold metallo-hydrolase [Corynebacterium guangdongense]|uniref:Glyoxylase-like metal-dependent hydrolase (Beta-lactamase superfamily II) n=1 Tax=Corynebacterium guangdongense TaxID=1783348 RepID=A0ABU1ZWZ2_9CORY|nr:MBL fold metallo-hydrolase [Corynebacterium guangdongense]MDR7329449.1 glyoxylase-like metal-dependent hydrolase (beta-lactamase superfamily II) [Corynebacterium guangdongense]WJZ18014.1 putative metallo-hydrolase [Corynebacterium guangdongense]